MALGGWSQVVHLAPEGTALLEGEKEFCCKLELEQVRNTKATPAAAAASGTAAVASCSVHLGGAVPRLLRLPLRLWPAQLAL